MNKYNDNNNNNKWKIWINECIVISIGVWREKSNKYINNKQAFHTF